MHTYVCTIAGVAFPVRTPWPLAMTGASAQFFGGAENALPGETVTVRPAATLPPLPEQGYWVRDRYFTTVEGGPAFFRREGPGYPPYALVCRGAEEVRCFCLPEGEEAFSDSRRLLSNVGLEALLLGHGGLILHAAFVEYGGAGVLFSAPSGMGKSTQAALWERHLGGVTVNGDRTGLRRRDGRWTAFGLPFAGSSGICRDDSAPVRAIVVLGQAEENTIRRLSPAEAAVRLFPELTVHRWDRNFVAGAMDLLAGLVAQVPVYALDCRPDRAAAELTRDTIWKEYAP